MGWLSTLYAPWQMVKWLGVFLLLGLVTTGCRQVRVEPEYHCLQQSACCRTQTPIFWERTLDQEQGNHNRIHHILKEEISVTDAIALALSNNRKLQTEFENLGLSKSDLVQAGLFTNPNLNVSWRLPKGQTSNESNFLFALTDLWQLPIRKRIAKREMEETLFSLTESILDTVAQAKRAYHNRQIALLALDEATDVLQQLKTLKSQIAYRYEFGLQTDLDMAVSAARVAKQQHRVLERTMLDRRANLELRFALGLNDCDPPIAVQKHVVSPMRTLPDRQELKRLARCCSPELLSLRAAVRAAEANVRLQRLRFIRVFDFGLAFNKEPGSPWGFGPGWSIQIPLFDQNQAQIAKANFLERRLKKRLHWKQDELIKDLNEAVTKYNTTIQQLTVYEDELLPALEEAMHYSFRYARTMQVTQVVAIQQQENLISARDEWFQLQVAAYDALVEIERFVGGSGLLPLCGNQTSPRL